jgi:acyl-CoA reductase-like NAD-dependent aldehyde dehydrogenase
VIGDAEAENLAPTVILNPARDSNLMKEEIFGPILPIVSY